MFDQSTMGPLTSWEDVRGEYCDLMRVSLEAAAPHMMTEAFEKGFQKGVEFQNWAGHLDNHKPDSTTPYRRTP